MRTHILIKTQTTVKADAVKLTSLFEILIKTNDLVRMTIMDPTLVLFIQSKAEHVIF